MVQNSHIQRKDFIQKIEDLQSQIDKLGEEIAVDMNQLEHKITSIQKQPHQVMMPSHSSNKTDANNISCINESNFLTQLEDGLGGASFTHMTNEQSQFLIDQLKRIQDFKVSIEDHKSLESKVSKLVKEIQINRKGFNRLNTVVKCLAEKLDKHQKLVRSVSPVRDGRSLSRSRGANEATSYKLIRELFLEQNTKLVNVSKEQNKLQREVEILKLQLNRKGLLKDTQLTIDLNKQISSYRQLISEQEQETLAQTSQFNDCYESFSNQNSYLAGRKKYKQPNKDQRTKMSQFKVHRGRQLQQELFIIFIFYEFKRKSTPQSCKREKMNPQNYEQLDKSRSRTRSKSLFFSMFIISVSKSAVKTGKKKSFSITPSKANYIPQIEQSMSSNQISLDQQTIDLLQKLSIANLKEQYHKNKAILTGNAQQHVPTHNQRQAEKKKTNQSALTKPKYFQKQDS